MDESKYTYPQHSEVRLSKEDRRRWDKNLKALQERAAGTCKHLIKGTGKKKKSARRRGTVKFANCFCTHETKKSLRIAIPDVSSDEIWIPKTAVHPDSAVLKPNTSGMLILFTWYVEESLK
jgi:hypothetical protein